VTPALSVLALALGAVSLELEAHDQISGGTLLALMGNLRTSIEARTGGAVLEGDRGRGACVEAPDCARILVRAFGGPFKIRVLLDRVDRADRAAKARRAAFDLPKDDMLHWRGRVDEAIDSLLEDTRPPPAVHETVPSASAPPPAVVERRSSIWPLALGGVAIASSGAAVGLALASHSARNRLIEGRYTASDYGGIAATLDRDRTLSEVFAGLALSTILAAVIVLWLE
jgi:hypothetical protein